MPLSTDPLKIWRSLEHLRLSEIIDGKIRKDNWGNFVEALEPHGGVAVYMCRRTCVAGTPDEEKRYALEATFTGSPAIERKFVVGNRSIDAFEEMRAYLGGVTEGGPQ